MRHWFLIGGLLTASAGHATVHVNSVTLTPTARGFRLSVNASGKTRYTLHTYPEPARLIMDIPDAVLDPDARVAPVEADEAPVLRFSQFTRKPDAVRVVVHLPDGAQTWRDTGVSPSSAIVIEIPSSAPRAVAANPGPRTRTRRHPAPAAEPTRSNATQHPRLPGDISAKELEHRQIQAAQERAGRVYGPPPHGTAAARASRAERTQLASRRGAVDVTDLMVDPAAAPAQAWDPDEAVSLIKETDCPVALRKRLIDVVSDPAIQTSRYVWGAQTPGQFDCSGLVLYIYEPLGVKLPRCSWQQCAVGEAVERDSLQAGDLLFFNTKGNGVSHVGIYLGDDRFLHAANPKSNLKITSLDSPYYATRYVGARRVYGGTTDTSNLGG
ncbi:MAG TPA: NlpC/P60 family protein [Armatimonadota bacterium]